MFVEFLEDLKTFWQALMKSFEKIKISKINYGRHSFEPSDVMKRSSYDGCFNVCSKCLYVFYNKSSLELHMDRCEALKNEIFKIFYTQTFPNEEKHKTIGFSKVNRIKNKQTLTALGESFISLKTNYFNVNEYDIYIAIDLESKDILGYFSKNTFNDNSLSCLVVFPPYKNTGIAKLLIDLSQQPVISSIKNDVEITNTTLYTPLGPERPLSAEASRCFRKYWAYKVNGYKTVKEAVENENLNEEDAIIGFEVNGYDFKQNEFIDKTYKIKRPRRILDRKLIKKK